MVPKLFLSDQTYSYRSEYEFLQVWFNIIDHNMSIKGVKVDIFVSARYIQYVWGQYAMHNLGANSLRPPVDKFTNFMVGRNPLVIERLLPLEIRSCIVARGLIFLPQNFAQFCIRFHCPFASRAQ